MAALIPDCSFFLHVCVLNNGDLRVTECHVASVYPCWDVGSETLAPHSHSKVTLSLSPSLSMCRQLRPLTEWVPMGVFNFVRSPLATLRFVSVPLHTEAS